MAELESLLELASILERQTDFQEVLRLVTQKAAGLLEAETALVMMINPSTGKTVKTLFREDRGAENRQSRFAHTYFSGWVIEKKQAFVSGNIHEDGRFNREVLKDFPVKSVMCAPMTSEGMVTGTLLLCNRINGGEFTPSDLDFLKKFASVVSPFLRNVQKIQRFFVAVVPISTLQKKYEAHGLIGGSRAFIELLTTIEAAAGCDVRVLLEGGSGTGKELVARAIHRCSSRMQNKFVAVDCGTIPSNLIESELFGHVRGAFTGAAMPRKGLMEEANGGSLFMDEITNLPLELQSRLLRVLQEGEIRPVGGNETRKVDVRIIAASSSPLRRMVADGQFREDLFYRLYVYPISVPSLKDRREDIPLLSDYFLKHFSGKQGKKIEAFQAEFLEFLKTREWPGNIRELENFVERWVTLAQADVKVLDRNTLPEEYRTEFENMKSSARRAGSQKPLKNLMADYEKTVIQKVLAECDGNQSKAARILKISEHTIRYKMQKLGLVKSPG